MQRSARERHVWNVPHTFVLFTRGDQVRTAARRDLPRLVQIQQRRAEGVDIAVARAKNTVVEQQPALRSLNRNGARTDLHALPRRHFERRGRHHMAVATPELHVGALRVEDVPESRMAVVARTREHGELPADLAWEKHPVAVERDKGVLQLVEGLEIIRPRDADRRAVVAVAPRNVVFILDLCHTRVIAINPLAYFSIAARQPEILLGDVPFQAIDREPYMDAHSAVGIVAAENTCIVILAFFKRYHRRVEDRVRSRQRIAPDNRVLRVTPQNLFTPRGAVLPRHIGQGCACYFQLVHIIYLLVYRYR